MAKKKSPTKKAEKAEKPEKLPKIESLTPEQQAHLEAYRDEWLKIGRSTDPSDRPNAERVWTAMYAALNKPAPTTIWFDGPARASIFRTLVSLFQMDTADAKAFQTRFRAQLGANLAKKLGLDEDANTVLQQVFGDDLLVHLAAALGSKLDDSVKQLTVEPVREAIVNEALQRLQAEHKVSASDLKKLKAHAQAQLVTVPV